MERSLLWSGVILGGIGWVCAALAVRARGAADWEAPPDIPRLFWGAAVALPLLVFLLTLPSRPPFAAGQGWGIGFLIGGLGALLATWGTLSRSIEAVPRAGTLGTSAQALGAVAGFYAMAVAAIGTPLLWMRSTILDGLTGVAMGWFCITFLLLVGLLAVPSKTEGEKGRKGEGEIFVPHVTHLMLALAAGTGFAVTLCASVALGVYRRPMSVGDVGPGAPWSGLALVYATGIPFVLLLSALPNRLFAHMALRLPFARWVAGLSGKLISGEEAREAAVRAWRLIFSLAVMLGLAKLLAVKAIPHNDVFYVATVGMAVGLITWWLLRDGITLGSASENAWLFPLAAMVVLTGCMAGFQMLAGYGVALVATGMWLAAGLALAGTVPQKKTPDQEERAVALTTTAGALTRVLYIGVVLAVYRLTVTRFEEDLRAASLSDFYAVFGFLAGVTLPSLFSGLLLRMGFTSEHPARSLLRIVFTGILVLAAPALIVALWGPKCVLTLLAGLALAGVVGRFWERPIVSGREVAILEGEAPADPRLTGGSPSMQVGPPSMQVGSPPKIGSILGGEAALITSLLALGMALTIAQWTHLALPLASLTRAEKIRLLVWALVILAGLVVGTDYGRRLIGRGRRQRAGASSAAGSEGAPR